MLYRLQEQQYERTRALFKDLRYNLVVDSVIDGNTPAWLYADDVDRPRAALMWNRQDALLLAGDPGGGALDGALAALLAGQVVPDARRRFIPELSLHYAPATWEGHMAAILGAWRPEKAWRRFYTFEGPRVDWLAGVPPGYEIRPLDRALLEDAGLEHVAHPLGWVRSFWPSLADFVDRGFGFCLLHRRTVTGWCLSVYASGSDYELGLATMPACRNRGLATLTAAACVAHCAARGWTPHWHCWEDNLPSIAVAEKVGFARPARYAVYRFSLEA